MITIKDMSFRYGVRGRQVFSDFNLDLYENRVYGLLGKNGTGKSTLLYLMTGLLRPNSGSVCCSLAASVAEVGGTVAEVGGTASENRGTAANGKASAAETAAPQLLRTADRRPEFLREVFLVPEEFDFPLSNLNRYVADNAPFYPRFSREVLDRCLQEFELTSNPNLLLLSMGQKKKVLISFALAAGTRFLLMDEPTNGLDIPSKSQFRKVIAQNMTDERMIVISTHQVHDIASLLDHIVILGDQSALLLNKSVAQLTEQYHFSTVPVGSDTAQALYSEPSPQGLSVVRERTPEMDETHLNVELLFNAVTKGIIR